MVFKKIHTDEELYDGIWNAFYGDTDMLEAFQLHNGGEIEECVYDVFCTLKDFASDSKCEFFHVIYDDSVIGYVAISRTNGFMYDFRLNILYRKQHILDVAYGYLMYLVRNTLTKIMWVNRKSDLIFLRNNSRRIYESCESEAIKYLN